MTATVLALRALGLGDTYAAVPALRGLRRAAPGVRLVLAGPPAWGALLVEQGVVDAVLPAAGLADLAWTGPRPRVAVNLHGCGPESHRLLRRLDPERLVAFACPAAGVADGPEWRPREHEVDRWIRLVASVGGPARPEDLRLDPPDGPVPHAGAVLVHPGAASGARRWPVPRWRAVLTRLAALGHPVAVTGGPQEAALTAAVASGIPDAVDLGGRLTARQLAQLVAAAPLLVSGDTGVAHLATAYRTPSITLFGPVAPALWGPAIDRAIHRVIWRPEAGDPPGDPHGEAVDPRLDRIRPSDVLALVPDLLARPVATRSGTT